MPNIAPNEKKYLSAIDAVCYWLGYQFKIGREQLIHEASLRYPMADTLTSDSISINQIVLEKLHPIFNSKKIDLVILNKSAVQVSDSDNINEVYEFKLAKSETAKKGGAEHQRVFDDVVRLAYFNLWKKKDCFFLMCGKYEDFAAYFVAQSTPPMLAGSKNIVTPRSVHSPQCNAWEPDGIYRDWFKFEINKMIEMTFDNTNESFGLSIFHSSYSIRKEVNEVFKSSIKIKTTCMAITPFGNTNRTHAAGIWKIEGICQE